MSKKNPFCKNMFVYVYILELFLQFLFKKVYLLYVTYQSVKPPGRNQNSCFYPKEMQNVLKMKNMQRLFDLQ